MNIGKLDDLIALTLPLGLSPVQARQAIERRTFREAVDTDWARSQDLGISGVPTFIMNGDRTVGAQPYDLLERFVRDSGEARRRS